MQTDGEPSISSLTDDVIYLIFKYLSIKDLCHLCQVCRRFQILASKDSVWIHNLWKISTVKHMFPLMSRHIQVKELCRIARNWNYGKYKEGFVIKAHRKHKLIPWIQKTIEGLWFSCQNRISNVARNTLGEFYESKKKCLLGLPDDATKFTVKDNVIASGCIDGSICVWDLSNREYYCHREIHSNEIQCVDFTDNVLVSGTRDGSIMLLPLKKRCRARPVKKSVGERIWCLNISPCNRYIAAGLAGWQTKAPLLLWDLESLECLGHIDFAHKIGAGIFDIKFESPQELLSCGYDTFMRLWDLRTLKCVIQWEEPFDSALYCLATDRCNTLAVGTAQYGMVRMWDKRKTEPAQAYYSYKSNSPVYSLAMDNGHLYLGLDTGLNILNFTAYHMPSKLNPSAFMGYEAG